MGWQTVTVPAYKVVMTDGEVYRAAGETGFVLKDGQSRLLRDMKEGDEFKNGRVVESVMEDGMMDYFMNKEDSHEATCDVQLPPQARDAADGVERPSQTEGERTS